MSEEGLNFTKENDNKEKILKNINSPEDLKN